jgi:hypothetical protein
MGDGATPLHIAVSAGNLKIVRFLIEKLNADIDKANHAGATPLMSAAAGKHEYVIKWLSKRAANLKSTMIMSEGREMTAADISKIVGASAEQTAYLEAKTHCSSPSCSGEGHYPCGDCTRARYCAKLCQKAHWPTHKADCERLSAEKKAGKMDKIARSRDEQFVRSATFAVAGTLAWRSEDALARTADLVQSCRGRRWSPEEYLLISARQKEVEALCDPTQRQEEAELRMQPWTSMSTQHEQESVAWEATLVWARQQAVEAASDSQRSQQQVVKIVKQEMVKRRELQEDAQKEKQETHARIEMEKRKMLDKAGEEKQKVQEDAKKETQRVKMQTDAEQKRLRGLLAQAEEQTATVKATHVRIEMEKQKMLDKAGEEKRKVQENAKKETQRVKKQTDAEQKRLKGLLTQAEEQTARATVKKKEDQCMRQRLVEELNAVREELNTSKQELTEAKLEVTAKTKELSTASTLATMPIVERVLGLADMELEQVKQAMVAEQSQRQRLMAQAEIRAVLESEREERMCVICLDHQKDTAFGCGHQSCSTCAEEISSCPICRQDITIRVTLY